VVGLRISYGPYLWPKGAAEVALPGGHGIFEELTQSLAKFRSMVVKRSQLTVPRDTFDGEADGPGESVEPLVLSEGALSANHARYLVEQAIEGTAFAAEDLGRVEVLFDHKRAYNQAMLVRDGLLRHCPEFCVLNTTLIGVLLHGGDEQPCEHASAIVGLAQEQLDVVFYGDRYECVQRFVVIASQEAARRHKDHPGVQQLRDRIGRLVLPSA
jgi:hypothetical protein